MCCQRTFFSPKTATVMFLFFYITSKHNTKYKNKTKKVFSARFAHTSLIPIKYHIFESSQGGGRKPTSTFLIMAFTFGSFLQTTGEINKHCTAKAKKSSEDCILGGKNKHQLFVRLEQQPSLYHQHNSRQFSTIQKLQKS